MAVISKGITVEYDDGEGYLVLEDVQEIPELGGDVDAIEITTLADAAHTYTDGIKNYGDSLSFKCLYAKQNFLNVNNQAAKGSTKWRVTFPDNTTCEFNGTCSVKMDGVGVNAALTFTVNVKPNSEMIWGGLNA